MEEHTANKWKETLDRVVPCCVVLKITGTRSFDTESAGSSFASGFVVDKLRGIILTNRHVVQPGPVTAEAVFLNREEIPVYPLYRDPVHDFGFVRFDPSKLRFMTLSEVPLAPEAASVGIDIRVVGNDSGEKVSILAGTLARLDRDAPCYSSKGYNDFNTFYLQAASGTKGGSSGSPVIDFLGRAVGLNAGSKTKTASAFFLPLNRVVRALDICQGCLVSTDGNAVWKSPDIPRGDIQATFCFKGFDEVRRLGLQADTEALVRSHKRQKGGVVGMLVVESIVPKGPSDGKLEAGDILVNLNSKTVTHFLDMEEILDGSVNEPVELVVVRGGKTLSFQIQVENLHRVTPSSFLEISGGSVHELSYQQARNYFTHTGQVYVADPGYMLSRAGIPRRSVIMSVNNEKTPDIETFATVISKISHGIQVPIKYIVFSDRYRQRSTLMHMDRKWYGPPVLWTRDDANGCWHRTKTYSYSGTVPEFNHAPKNSEDGMKIDENIPKSVDASSITQGGIEDIKRGLVLVDVEIPEVALADGVHAKSFIGNGVIVHQDENIGLVLVDRNTVAIGLCDIRLSFGAYPVEIEGVVRFLHPLHNFAIISYDVRRLGQKGKEAVIPCKLSYHPSLARGDKVTLVGLSRALRVTARSASVTNAAVNLNIPTADIPRFHAVNEEGIQLDQDFGSSFSGVLVDSSMSVRALWGSFAKQVNGEERELCSGIHCSSFVDYIPKVLEYIRSINGQTKHHKYNSIPVVVTDIEFDALLLSKAAKFGLPQEWIDKLANYDTERKQVLHVKSCVAGSDAKAKLNEGDMILAISNKIVSSFNDVNRIIEEHCSNSGSMIEGDLTKVEDIVLKVYRNKEILDIPLKLNVVDGLGTNRLVHWAGAQLQDSYRAVRERGFLPEPHGVYISRWHHGSPAHRYGLYALHWILEVNGVKVPNLEAFLHEISKFDHESFVRLKVCHLDNKPKLISLRLDLRFWPTWELQLNHLTGTWSRKVLKQCL